MHKISEGNLKASFAGESQAHIKYLSFAEVAEKEGFPNIARLFRAASFSEQSHATGYLRQLGGIGDTASNLKEAFGGEGFEVEEMYPAYLAVAEAQNEPGAKRSFQIALEAEKVHLGLYNRALEATSKNQDLVPSSIHVCLVCGFTMEGEAPEKCPICGAPKKIFKDF